MRSIAFFNNKGGVGKTTLLCNVAAYLSIHKNKKICVVDGDPQCNATQYFLNEDKISEIYGSDKSFTAYSVIEPLASGEGYNSHLETIRSSRFGVDVLPGDPRLALTEDLLARDWVDAISGNVRGIKTSLVFSELLRRLHQYDFVFFDVSPSLGALNRSIMLSSDFFLSPVSVDIFSLKAFENIASWVNAWWSDWSGGIERIKDKSKKPELEFGRPEFLGYVTQQYLAKKDGNGQRRAVLAYENIRNRIDDVIMNNDLFLSSKYGKKIEIGTVPNLFSLVPMSQSNNAPIFELTASDGIVGAHFYKVKDARHIFSLVSEELLNRVNHG